MLNHELFFISMVYFTRPYKTTSKIKNIHRFNVLEDDSSSIATGTSCDSTGPSVSTSSSSCFSTCFLGEGLFFFGVGDLPGCLVSSFFKFINFKNCLLVFFSLGDTLLFFFVDNVAFCFFFLLCQVYIFFFLNLKTLTYYFLWSWCFRFQYYYCYVNFTLT